MGICIAALGTFNSSGEVLGYRGTIPVYRFLCMTELEEILARLGLSQYLGRLIDEGFEKWETVLDITEQDL